MNTTTDRLLKGVSVDYIPEPTDWPLVIFRVLRVALWTALIVGVTAAVVMTA